MRLAWGDRYTVRALVLVFAAAAVAVAGIMSFGNVRPLSATQGVALAEFVDATGSGAVRRAFDAANDDGVITERESRTVIDVAKAQPVPYGLLRGDGPDR